MKDYKRVTEKDSCYYDDMERIDDLGGADILYDRLAELEDKIESGELCDGAELEQVKKDRDEYKHRAEVADIVISELRAKLSKSEHDRDRYARRISSLQAENAALRERLDKAVELPCKVGDTVWWVHEAETNKFEIQEGNVVSLSIDNTGVWVYCRYKSGLTYWHTEKEFCKEVTTDPAAAEKRLAELKGEDE